MNYNRPFYEEIFKLFDSENILDAKLVEGIFLGMDKKEIEECLKVWGELVDLKYGNRL